MADSMIPTSFPVKTLMNGKADVMENTQSNPKMLEDSHPTAKPGPLTESK